MSKEPLCPKCGSSKLAIERRPNGNATCMDCRHAAPYLDFFKHPCMNCGFTNLAEVESSFDSDNDSDGEYDT